VIHLQSFKDKLVEFEKIKEDEDRLKKELHKDAEEIKFLTVDILDEILGNEYKKKINVDIKVNNKNIYKIEHDCPDSDTQRDLNLHRNGINTMIFWGNQKNSLWNFLAGGNENYDELATILDYLMIKYPKQYKNVLIKKDESKFNL
jgi:hypothetical protein